MSVGAKRHTSVKEQQIAADFVETAAVQEDADVALELLTAGESGDKRIEHFLLGGAQAARVACVHRGEYGIEQLVDLAVDLHRAVREIDAPEQVAVLQTERGVARNEGGFDLELDDGHGLLDFHVTHPLGFRKHRRALQPEGRARVVRIGAGGELREGGQVDAVDVFEHRKVAVARAYAHHVRDAARLACRCAHPHDVVIAPLDVGIRRGSEHVHDRIRRRTSVVDIAHEVQGAQAAGAGADAVHDMRGLLVFAMYVR